MAKKKARTDPGGDPSDIREITYVIINSTYEKNLRRDKNDFMEGSVRWNIYRRWKKGILSIFRNKDEKGEKNDSEFFF